MSGDLINWLTLITAAQETRPFSRCCSFKLRNRWAYRNGRWMVCGICAFPTVNRAQDRRGRASTLSMRNNLPCFPGHRNTSGAGIGHTSRTQGAVEMHCRHFDVTNLTKEAT